MEERKIKVLVNGEERIFEGEQAELFEEFKKHNAINEDIGIRKKENDKKLRSIKLKVDSLFTDNERKFNEKNVIDIPSPIGDGILETFTFKTKGFDKPALIDKKALVNIICDGLQNGFIEIKTEDFIAYLLGQQYAIPVEDLEELEENISASDFTTLLKKTKTIPSPKEELDLKQN